MDTGFTEQVQDIAADNAWRTTDVLLYALDFIENSGMGASFLAFLKDMEREENERIMQEDAEADALAEQLLDVYDPGWGDHDPGYEVDEP